ncbi:MAG: hypothetical protein PHT94_01060 [Candidatus Nanoarchaeia archaeon]|nr:hypothetical protein [Candidatus Nanoarchaeia archaeon]
MSVERNPEVGMNIRKLRSDLKLQSKYIRHIKGSLSLIKEDSYQRSKIQSELDSAKVFYRYGHILFGLVRNKPYYVIESNPIKNVNWRYLKKLARKYDLENEIDFNSAAIQFLQVYRGE